MNTSIRNKYSLSALLLLFCSIPLLATAAIKTNESGERIVSVQIDDLNLSEQQGVAVLFRRLQRASDQVCGSRNRVEAGSLKQRQLNQRCYSETLSEAVQQFDNAELSQLYARSNRLP